MKIRYVFCALFALLAAAAIVGTVHTAMDSRDAETVLVSTPPDAQNVLTGALDCICHGDYTAAEAYFYGQPSLGVDREPQDAVGKLVWEAYISSLSYELSGECYATDDGLAQNVELVSLDVNSVTANLGERTKAELERMMEESLSPTEIYDENHEYRPEVVQKALYEAAKSALHEDAQNRNTTVTVKLIYRDEKWWVVCDEALLGAVSGGLG